MKSLAVLTVLALATVSGIAQERTPPEQGLPPTNLQQRDGHWTANGTPPDTTDFEVHIVQAGETLWGIAGRFMGNPFLWPQLWETNEHIVNPHWIYPEDRILIRPVTEITNAAPPPVPQPVQIPEPPPRRTVQLPTLGLVDAEELPPPDTFVLDLSEPRTVPEVKMSDLYCSGFVTTQDVRSGGAVIAQFPPSEGILSAEGDYVYINRGEGAGTRPGEMFTVIRGTREIQSTRSGVGDLGRHFLELGQLRVVIVQPEFSLARVVHSCGGAMEVGDSIVGFEEIDFPDLPRDRPFSAFMPSTGKTIGAIAIARDPLLNSRSPVLGGTTAVPGVRSGHLKGLAGGLVGEGGIVYLDLGLRDGVQAGNVFLIYRPLDFDAGLSKLGSETERLLRTQREVVGELVVLKVRERASTALITFSAVGVSAGDLVELR